MQIFRRTSPAAPPAAQTAPTVSAQPPQAATVPTLSERATQLLASIDESAPLDKRLELTTKAVNMLVQGGNAAPALLAATVATQTRSRFAREQILRMGLTACTSATAVAGNTLAGLSLRMMAQELEENSRAAVGRAAVAQLDRDPGAPVYLGFASPLHHLGPQASIAATTVLLQEAQCPSGDSTTALADRVVSAVKGDERAVSSSQFVRMVSGQLSKLGDKGAADTYLLLSAILDGVSPIAGHFHNLRPADVATTAFNTFVGTPAPHDLGGQLQRLLKTVEQLDATFASVRSIYSSPNNVSWYPANQALNSLTQTAARDELKNVQALFLLIRSALSITPKEGDSQAARGLKHLVPQVDTSGPAVAALTQDLTCAQSDSVKHDILGACLKQATDATSDASYSAAFKFMQSLTGSSGLPEKVSTAATSKALQALSAAPVADPLKTAVEGMLRGVDTAAEADLVLSNADDQASSSEMRAWVRQTRDTLVEQGLEGMRHQLSPTAQTAVTT